jgi:hypothetical protein
MGEQRIEKGSCLTGLSDRSWIWSVLLTKSGIAHDQVVCKPLP